MNADEEQSMLSADIQPEDVITADLSGADQNLEVMIIEDGVGLLLDDSHSKRPRLDTADSILESHVEVLQGDDGMIASDTVTLPSGIEGGYSAWKLEILSMLFLKVAQASSALLTLQSTKSPSHPFTKERSMESPKKPVPNILKSLTKAVTPVKKQGGFYLLMFFVSTFASAVLENEGLSLTFNEWLGSVTERVNQTMHYQFDGLFTSGFLQCYSYRRVAGNPEPLVFHSPQKFFDILQHRISTGNRKRRLPNSTTGFVRKDALPLGTFTKYTWHITNILHVKQIFDTPGVCYAFLFLYHRLTSLLFCRCL
jgi:hypothetical protein